MTAIMRSGGQEGDVFSLSPSGDRVMLAIRSRWIKEGALFKRFSRRAEEFLPFSGTGRSATTFSGSTARLMVLQ